MEVRTLGRAIFGIGIGGGVLSFLWWLAFYAYVVRFLGGEAHDLGQLVWCTFSNTVPCGPIKQLATAAGYMPYEPLALWLSLGLILVGIILGGWMDRFIDGIELIAAVFIGIVAFDVFITVVLRRFGIDIPDSYDFGQLLLGILIFWGIAATSYRGTHITVDLLWANVGPRAKRYIDVFATLVLLFVVTVQTYTLQDKVDSTYHANIETFTLRLPTWPFAAVAWLGDVSAVMLIAVRTYRLVFQPEKIARAGDVARAVE